MAQGFNSQYDEVVASFSYQFSEAVKKEFEQLEALITEIEKKIADTQNMKREAHAKQKV